MGTWEKYEPLTTETVVQYLVDKEIVVKEDTFTVREIGDGNLNLVFHVVKEGESTGIIVKQALPYAKVVGESWPLTLLRATIESGALSLHKQYATDLVPEVLLHDTTLATIVMEDLSSMTIYRKALIDGADYPHTATHIGRYIAHTHFYTSDFYVDEATKKRNVQTFYNPELCKITEDLVYTDPFYDASTNAFESALRPDVENLWNDEELLLHTAQLKWSFMNEAETLVHGDLHTGSIFATPERTQVIDPEFAFYGPLGFDLGQFVANLIMQAYTRPEEKRAYLLESIRTVVTTFESEFEALHAKAARTPFT
ncbi:MAG: S-methyl-5-thioribose kinase, partial [Bacilli bacterium]